MEAKDLIIDINNVEEVKPTERNYSRPIPVFTITVENDSDIAIRKTTKCTKKLLVLMLSQALLYIKDEKTGTVTNITEERQIKSFFGGYFDEVPAIEKLKYDIIVRNWREDNVSSFLRYAIMYRENAQLLVRAQIYERDTAALDVLKTHNKKYLQKLIDIAKSLGTTISHLNGFLNSCETNGYDVNIDKILFNADKMKHIPNICSALGDTYYGRSLIDCLKYCDFNRLMDYLLNEIVNYQRLEVNYGFRFSDYYDYLNMQHEMYGYVKEKYPDNFLSEKAKLIYKYNLWKRAKDNEIFIEALKSSFAIEYKPEKSKYWVIAPVDANAVIDEGQQMHHCVASYVNSIKNQQTRVLFIREKDHLEDSLVTIEVTNNNALVQARCICNTDPDEELTRFIIEYAEALKLDLSYCNGTGYSKYVNQIRDKIKVENEEKLKQKEQIKEKNKEKIA